MQISDELLKLVSDLEIAVFNGAPRPAIVGSFGRLRAALSALSLPVQPVAKRWLVEETLEGGSIKWNCVEHEHHARSMVSPVGNPVTVTPLYTTPPVPPSPAERGREPVAVKQMEWYPDPGAFPYNTWGAQSSFGRFTIEEVSASDSPAYEARYTPHHLIAIKDSLEDAKAAAQADYEYRIRSALTGSAPRAKEVERVILQKRPRAFIIEYASGEYDIFRDEGLAATKAEENGVEYHGLYRRTTPPVPPTKGPEDDLIAAREAVIEAISERSGGNPSPRVRDGTHDHSDAVQSALIAIRNERSRPASALPVVGEAELLTRALAYLDDIYNPDDDALYTLRAAIRSALIPSVQP